MLLMRACGLGELFGASRKALCLCVREKAGHFLIFLPYKDNNNNYYYYHVLYTTTTTTTTYYSKPILQLLRKKTYILHFCSVARNEAKLQKDLYLYLYSPAKRTHTPTTAMIHIIRRKGEFMDLVGTTQ